MLASVSMAWQVLSHIGGKKGQVELMLYSLKDSRGKKAMQIIKKRVWSRVVSKACSGEGVEKEREGLCVPRQGQRIFQYVLLFPINLAQARVI